ncbi:carbamoyl-phosphate synthase large subunit [bacterium]|jgi:carbamoyl-phosphate synthase large subunit|nr:carbamoyl-phosphate synthase large subunit [bacterium]
MPKRNDIKKILLIGSGPIIIGQACEFDYSGTQACKALREEGYEVVLVNSNPATIMTDPETADKTYIEPLTVEAVTRIIELERPDAILPTVGGQTGLNLGMDLDKNGVLKKYNVEMIGANAEVIEKAEDRNKFKAAMTKIGYSVPKSEIARTLDEARKVSETIGFPCIIRAAFTMGGTGGGIAYNIEELESIAANGIDKSPISEILIEQSVLGWKEYELEVMRDKADNVVIVCSIENLDPMGVHTGDSITVAPAQTLTDKEYQMLRNASLDVMREIGVETGGSNVQFAINPDNGDMIIIEMNPRVSRSSALASKATGFPIAKLAAKLAVGYTLDELTNDITKNTPACFEPTLDYCVVKIPRFNFEKFPKSKPELGVSMKSVGEAMAIGRTFKEAMQKALRSLETKRFGFGFDGKDLQDISDETLLYKLTVPNPDRLEYVFYAMRSGMTLEKLHDISNIDPWFLTQLAALIKEADQVTDTEESIKSAKQKGFSDVQLARLLNYENEKTFRKRRKELGVKPTFKIVDTCAGEFEAQTPYFYSTYEEEDESRETSKDKVMILGGGPNRIGQGIEFDYCCVHASYAIREEGMESIMVNSNPETVSTDFDTSDKLYFEPLTYEDVLNIYEAEKPKGVIVQFGGQTPLNLADRLEQAGLTILGTSYDSIDRAEDRERFQEMIQKLDLLQPDNGTVTTTEQAIQVANRIHYPVLVRPSYVLGGASMEIVYSDKDLATYMDRAIATSPDHPILIDKYLEEAIEVDVDALSDGNECVVAGIMEHIEEAGIHSGDSASVLPPHSISAEIIETIRQATKAVAIELKVIGLLNIQFAIKNDLVYILEVNPRASRTVPFVSKATDIPWAKLATKVMLGTSIKDLNVKEVVPKHVSVKESVFPFNRFPEVDTILGPEMKSTGEVMGIDKEFGMAFIKAQMAAGQHIPKSGSVFISVKDSDKTKILESVRILAKCGYTLIATTGTAAYLSENGIPCDTVKKVYEGRPNVVDKLKNGEVQWVINTPSGKNPIKDEIVIRQVAYQLNIPVVTTSAGAIATVNAIQAYRNNDIEVKSLQSYRDQANHEVFEPIRSHS